MSPLLMRAPLSVAVVQPTCAAKDLSANAQTHALAIRAAQARLVVFPELSLTGYELDADLVSPGDETLTPIVIACAAAGSIALVGAPIEESGRVYIAMLRVSSAGIEIAYRKSFLGDDEATRFGPGDKATALEIDGWRVGLGICKDTRVAKHVRDTAALDVDAYVAGLVHLPEELATQDERGPSIAHECEAYVAFSSFAGATGGGFDRTTGRSTIWSPDGTALARTGSEPGGIARATLI